MIASKWSGQCNACHAWNTLSEELVIKTDKRLSYKLDHTEPLAACYLDDVDISGQPPRLYTGMLEFDRVVGGGLTIGSVTLIGGDPGIGKSTLLMQIVSVLSSVSNVTTLYVSAEESAQQISLNSQRLGLALDKIRLLTETCLEKILSVASSERPMVMIIDSIQTIHTEMSRSASGAVTQIRECAAQLVRYAKQTNTAVLLVGHVTKDGSLAGPRVLEHMVDTVLYFEGDTNSRYRVIRSTKNRYGAVNELGVFAMTSKGLKEISNPSAIFLSRHLERVSGSLVMVTIEGTRALLVEVQALVDDSHTGNPRRISVGLEQNRLSMLLAVLHRHAAINTFGHDVFVNIVGGIKITETAADIAIILAVISSLQNSFLPQDLVAFGELGLAGEIRPVQSGQERLNEAVKHGFKKAIIPTLNKPKQDIKGMDIIGVSRLSEAISALQQYCHSSTT